jgi:hypothetical protein
MARLTAAKRNALPDSAFAGPGRTYPVNDKAHAIAAKRLSGRGVAAGNISPATKKRIVARANRVAPGGLQSALSDAAKRR